MTDFEFIRKDFIKLADICKEEAPLYGVLAANVASDTQLLSLASGGREGNPPANLLFGAVHYLLLNGASHDLRSFYRTVGGTKDASGAFPAFQDFCKQHSSEIRRLVHTRRVQTNEVGRTGLLLPAFSLSFDWFQRPLRLIEIGASAGLNLCFDAFEFRYSGTKTCKVGNISNAVVHVQLRGELAPVRIDVPEIAHRVGVDLSPIDFMDDDAMTWLQALIWPDHLDRMALLRSAIAIARSRRPSVIGADGLKVVQEIAPDGDSNSVPCVFHSHAIYQMTPAWRNDFQAALESIGSKRDLAHISLEWLGDDPDPQLHLTLWRDGTKSQQHLAQTHHHGRWMRWLATFP